MEYVEREQVSLRDKIDGTRPKMNFSPRLFRMLNNNNLWVLYIAKRLHIDGHI